LILWLGIEILVELNNLDFYLFGTARNEVICHYRKKEGQLKGENSLIAQLDLLEALPMRIFDRHTSFGYNLT